jgi:RNA polymerase sigma factor (sigma-70 family)
VDEAPGNLFQPIWDFKADMESLQALILRARGGDADAYAEIVRRFQDMAVGYSYAILRDFQLAEDAAQEAFFEAYRNLANLKEPAAFPGWFRRIVFKQCDRITRRHNVATVPLESIDEHASKTDDQTKDLERREMRERLWEALDLLPKHERTATMLYYISGYSQQEISRFLDTPVTAIKKRIFVARQRLRGMLLDVFQDSLREQRPSRDDAFTKSVMDILKAARSGDLVLVRKLLEQDPRLLTAKDRLGNTALILAVDSGHQEVAELLLSSGVNPDIYEAAAIGKTDLVASYGQSKRDLLDSYSPEGFTPLALAAHFGHREAVEFLLDSNVAIDAVSRNELGVTPLHAALYGRKRDIARLLVERGANVRLKRGGKKIPRSGWTALHYAAAHGYVELIPLLIDAGADVNATDDEHRTPFMVASAEHQDTIAKLLHPEKPPSNHKE